MEKTEQRAGYCDSCFLPFARVRPSDANLAIDPPEMPSKRRFPKGKDTLILICKNPSCKKMSLFHPDKWFIYT